MDLLDQLSKRLTCALDIWAQMDDPANTEFLRETLYPELLGQYREAVKLAGSIQGCSDRDWLPAASQAFLLSHTGTTQDWRVRAELNQLHIGLLRILLAQPHLEIPTYSVQVLEPLERRKRLYRVARLVMIKRDWKNALDLRWRRRLSDARAELLFITLSCNDAVIERRIRRLCSDKVSMSLLAVYNTHICGKLGGV